MKRALILMLPTRSHINAVLRLAGFLRDNHYEVYFLCSQNKALLMYITKQGFFTLPTDTIPCALPWEVEWNFYKLRSAGFKAYITDKLSGKLFTDRHSFLEKTIETVNPSLILIDSFIGADFLCVYGISKNKKIRIRFVNTMGVFYKKGLPSPTTILFPEQRWRIRLSEIRQRMLNYGREITETALLLGKSSRQLIYKKVKALGISPNDCLLDNWPMGTTFKKYAELVLSGHDFDFPEMQDTGSNRKLIGMMLDIERVEIVDPDYHRLLDLLKSKKDIIYVSFGSLAGRQRGNVERFLKLLPEVSARLPGVNFVIAGIKGTLPETLKNCPYIQSFRSVPQQTVLSRSKVFITHGGFNSIKESIYFMVPMIVYPINMKYDQNGNAARVLYHKIGLYGNIRNETSTCLLDKLNTVLNDRSYTSNIASLRKKLLNTASSESLSQILFD